MNDTHAHGHGHGHRHVHTLADLIADAAARHGERPALTITGGDADETWSYARLHTESRRVARMLEARGIAPGERLVLWAPNGPWWVGTFFGCMLAGVVLVPLDLRSGAEFVQRVLTQTEPRLAVAARAVGDQLDALSVPWLAVDELRASLPDDDPAWRRPPIGPDDVAEVMFTSGTTGVPKGVILSHANILTDLAAAEEHIPPRASYRILSLLPLSHSFEQIAELFFALSAGARVTYVESLQPATIFRAMREGGITAIPVVPQVLGLFMGGIEREVRKSGQWRRWQLAHRVAPYLPINARRLLFRAVHARLGRCLDFVVSGGAYVDPHLAQRWENLGIKVVIGYGLTECSPIVTINSLQRRNLRSVGRPLSCNRVTLAPDGEILVQGSNVTRGYWHNDEATRAAFHEGWYQTGDLGYMGDDGYLYLKGRKKNMIALPNGMNVYPEDIENALMQEDGVVDAVVVGRERDNDVDLHAILLLRDAADAAAIVRAVNRRLAAHQRLKGQTVWPDEDFPRTHTLKPRRDDMVRRLDELSKA